MKTQFVMLLLTLFSILGCKNNQPNDAESTETTGRQTNVATGDFIIVPGKSMGKITTANSSKEAVVAAYGTENVREDSVYVGEGFSLPGLVVFPGTKNELRIAYDPQISPTQPAFMRVETAGGDWKTASGLSVGDSLQEVITANGRDFKFSGFGWDYGGTITHWEGGNLEGLMVRLDLASTDMPTDKFMGDREISSSEPDLAKLDIKVSSISLRF